jgi:hypothetical protein
VRNLGGARMAPEVSEVLAALHEVGAGVAA